MKPVKVTTKGRVTIPALLRKKYKIKPGTRVNLVEEKDGIKIIRLTKETIRTNAGFPKIRGKSLLKALMEEKKKECEL